MKRIFLTGSSSGIGLATAKALLGRGHEVWGTARDPGRVPALARLHAIRLDLRERESIAAAWAQALGEAGTIDVLINNAGSGHLGAAEFLSSDTLRDQFELLVFAHIELCQLALRAMQAQRHGLIINVTSLASRLPIPFSAGYNAGKAALASWTLTAQLELGDSPIRLLDVQPGDICTDFNHGVRKEETTEPRYQARMERAWAVAEKNVWRAPQPELVAERIANLLDDPTPPPRVTVGDAFQAIVAPALFSLLPPRARVWALRKYYGI